MPVFEVRCGPCGVTEDVYLPKWDRPNPPCERCAGPRERLVSRFGFPFSGSIHKYMDPTREGSSQDGCWMYKKVSSLSGQPEPVWIGSMAELKAFNKAEGLAAPGEVPTNATVSADGKRILSNGMPGQWNCTVDLDAARGMVAHMTTSLTSLKGKSPEPTASGPPCSAQVVDTGLMEKFTLQSAPARKIRPADKDKE